MKVAAAILFVLGVVVTSTWGQDCWWTGCQPEDWATRGCAQYNRVERGRRECRDNRGVTGNEYQCCAGEGGGGNPPAPPQPPSGGGRPGGESGECSWYGAEGEIPPGHVGPCDTVFDRFAMEVAHKTLPCGTRLRVRNKRNGKTVDVKVSDRGPFVQGRILDLTYEAFGRVEDRDRGVFPCDYTIL
ncbi:unnamed protein product [Orchesella dallaii]|uniref:RlpA-like protein double-psi beta-barrel domain-containing protein n=1 Tax=Orchesella dallaii TaxID=48710 RepID=A0ABP1RIG4_9HEXA